MVVAVILNLLFFVDFDHTIYFCMVAADNNTAKSH